MNLRKNSEKHGYLDLFWILFLALVLVGSGIRIYGLRVLANEGAGKSFWVEMESRGVDALSADCIAFGETLYGLDGSVFGRVLEVDTVPLSETIFENGEAFVGEWEVGLQCRIRLRVECTGNMRSGVFLHNGKTPLGIGESFTLVGKKSELSWRVVEIGKSGEAR